MHYLTILATLIATGALALPQKPAGEAYPAPEAIQPARTIVPPGQTTYNPWGAFPDPSPAPDPSRPDMPFVPKRIESVTVPPNGPDVGAGLGPVWDALGGLAMGKEKDAELDYRKGMQKWRDQYNKQMQSLKELDEKQQQHHRRMTKRGGSAGVDHATTPTGAATVVATTSATATTATTTTAAAAAGGKKENPEAITPERNFGTLPSQKPTSGTKTAETTTYVRWGAYPDPSPCPDPNRLDLPPPPPPGSKPIFSGDMSKPLNFFQGFLAIVAAKLPARLRADGIAVPTCEVTKRGELPPPEWTWNTNTVAFEKQPRKVLAVNQTVAMNTTTPKLNQTGPGMVQTGNNITATNTTPGRGWWLNIVKEGWKSLFEGAEDKGHKDNVISKGTNATNVANLQKPPHKIDLGNTAQPPKVTILNGTRSIPSSLVMVPTTKGKQPESPKTNTAQHPKFTTLTGTRSIPSSLLMVPTNKGEQPGPSKTNIGNTASRPKFTTLSGTRSIPSSLLMVPTSNGKQPQPSKTTSLAGTQSIPTSSMRTDIAKQPPSSSSSLALTRSLSSANRPTAPPQILTTITTIVGIPPKVTTIVSRIPVPSLPMPKGTTLETVTKPKTSAINSSAATVAKPAKRDDDGEQDVLEKEDDHNTTDATDATTDTTTDDNVTEEEKKKKEKRQLLSPGGIMHMAGKEVPGWVDIIGW